HTSYTLCLHDSLPIWDGSVGGALETGVGCGEQVVALEPVAGTRQQHVDGGEHAEVAAGRTRHLETALLAPAHTAVDEVADHRTHDGDQQHELAEGDEHVDQRQREDVEGDVVAEDGIRLPYVLRVRVGLAGIQAE